MHETIKKLRLYNKWRRGDEELPQPDPREIGLWIDEICNYAEEVGAKCDQLRVDAQREAEHHDRMVGELERVYDERDEARRLNAPEQRQREPICPCCERGMDQLDLYAKLIPFWQSRKAK